MNIWIPNADLGSQPAKQGPFASKFPERRAGWVHIVNLSPYCFELLDEDGVVRSVITAFRERAVRLKVRTDYLFLNPVATQTQTSYPSTDYAVYGEVLSTCPVMVGNLAT